LCQSVSLALSIHRSERVANEGPRSTGLVDELHCLSFHDSRVAGSRIHVDVCVEIVRPNRRVPVIVTTRIDVVSVLEVVLLVLVVDVFHPRVQTLTCLLDEPVSPRTSTEI